MIKVFYRETETLTEEFEVVNVERDVVEEMRDELEGMEKCILERSKMGIWKVGYLPRH